MEHSQGVSKKHCEHVDNTSSSQRALEPLLSADGWQNAISDTYFDLKVQVKNPNQFTGQLQQATLAQMGISSYIADSVHYQRSGQDLSKACDSILLTFPLNGSVCFQQQKRQLTCYPGQFFIELSHQPYQFYHAVNTPFLTQHHRRIIKPPVCTQQVSYH